MLATWKLGAVPIPVRWDVPDWELDRLKEVIEPKVYIGPDDLAWIDATADDPVAGPARRGLAEQQRHLQQRRRPGRRR